MSSRALVLPHYSLPEVWRMKYLALLFEHIAIPNPKDEAVVNVFDWEENPAKKFKIERVVPAAQMPFLRDAHYAERYKALVASLDPLLHRGTLEILPRKPASREESRKLLRFVAETLANPKLVEAAVPDRTLHRPPFQIPGNVWTRPYDFDFEWIAERTMKPSATFLGTPHKIPNADEAWSDVAWLRLGSTAKFLRKACLMDAVPTAIDDATSHLLLAIATGAGSPIARPQQQDLAFTWDILNPHKLRVHLDQMSWKDVIDLRRQILPAFGRIRTQVQSRIQRLGPSQATDLEQYRSALAALRKEFEDLQAKEHEQLRSTIVKALFTVGGAASAAILVVAGTWPILATILGGGAFAAGDLQGWLLSRRGKRKHVLYPLFSLEQAAQETADNALVSTNT